MDFLTNILSGGVLGVVTSLFGTYMKHKEEKEKREFRLKEIAAQSDASIAEIKAQIEVQQSITEGQIGVEYAKSDVAESVGRNDLIEKLTGKYISDAVVQTMLLDKTWVGQIFKPLIYLHLMVVDLIRALVRPALTVGIFYYVHIIIDEGLKKYLISGNDVVLMTSVIEPSVSLILFSASTVVGFWFADKSMARRYQQKNKK